MHWRQQPLAVSALTTQSQIKLLQDVFPFSALNDKCNPTHKHQWTQLYYLEAALVRFKRVMVKG